MIFMYASSSSSLTYLSSLPRQEDGTNYEHQLLDDFWYNQSATIKELRAQNIYIRIQKLSAAHWWKRFMFDIIWIFNPCNLIVCNLLVLDFIGRNQAIWWRCNHFCRFMHAKKCVSKLCNNTVKKLHETLSVCRKQFFIREMNDDDDDDI